MRQVGAALWPKLRVVQVYGANTGVGKTIFSSILCQSFQKPLRKVYYLKPISTGPVEEADDRHISRLSTNATARCLYQFSKPVSPHIAARNLHQDVSDDSILAAVHDELTSYAHDGEDGIAIVETAGGVLSPAPSGSSQADLYRPLRMPVFLVGDHRLGGIATTISAWESLHVRGYNVRSVALFAESRYDNHSYLKDYFRDRDVHAFSVSLPPERALNPVEDAEAMREYYAQAASTASVADFTEIFLQAHDDRIAALQAMPAQAHETIWHPFMQHSERSPSTVVAMDSAYGDYFQTYSAPPDDGPQQATRQGLEQGNQLAQPQQKSTNNNTSLLTPAFDGSASWWTQGLGHGNPSLALTAAHAAGRYGHVMFASAVHAPALTLAQTLLQRTANPRLAKVFYSDNGSTGMEVAVKMALRAASCRFGWKSGEDEVGILGLRGSYHGDTMGTMDCSEPSVYNSKVEWYRGRGHWVDFPQIKMREGRWLVEVPESLMEELGDRERTFESLGEVFDFDARKPDWMRYRQYCDGVLQRLRAQGAKLGALIMEPVLLGAGGMLFADPLFQRALVDAVRSSPHTSDKPMEITATPTITHTTTTDQSPTTTDWTSLPIIFDEVFTGLYRLGRFSAASFVGAHPDILVNAKLLTGGLLPLCTTAASNSIFAAFLSADKSDALLHGHSYTAHAVGCAVANYSLDAIQRIEGSEAWGRFREDWGTRGEEAGVDGAAAGVKTARLQQQDSPLSSSSPSDAAVWSMWSLAFTTSISYHAHVDSVFALGSVLAITLKDRSGKAGYVSTAAMGLRDRLLKGGGSASPLRHGHENGSGNGEIDGEGWVVHSRVLGNVLYLMAAMTTSAETLRGVEARVVAALASLEG